MKKFFLGLAAVIALAASAAARDTGSMYNNRMVAKASTFTATPAGGGGGGYEVKIATAWQGPKVRQNGGEDNAMTVTMAPSTGSLIVVGAIAGSSFTTVVDSRGNTFSLNKFTGPVGGISTAMWHFIATATYNGGYVVTVNVEGASSIISSVLVASVTAGATPSVDVTTNTSASLSNSVSIGTVTTSATTDLVVACFADDGGLNNAIATSGTKLIAMFAEADGTSFARGACAFQTLDVRSTTTNGQWNLAVGVLNSSVAIATAFKWQ